jgi:hypothetical protein
MTKDEIIKALRDMARYPTVTLPRDSEALKVAADLLAQPEQEPVAWLHWLHGPVRLFLNKDEAMMELDRLNREYPVDKDARQMKPLYTSPPQRKPLTDEEMADFLNDCYRIMTEDELESAIKQAAHGIKGEA